MATEKAALRVTELDFDTIRENLKTYLRSQDEFQDYDFEGSGLAVLLDILAYNTHYMGFYLNMVGNEMFLDTAQVRSSVLSLAKAIGYVPESRKGALSRLNITATPSNTEDQDTTIITLQKYTKLLGSDVEGVNYPFVTLYSNTSSKSDGAFAFSNIYVKQGEVSTQQFLMTPTNTTRRFDIPSANVDLDSLVVTVQASTSNTDTHQYTLADDITELTANSMVYFVEENENLNYTIYFGDDYIGKKPQDGSVIICTYLDTVGSPANNISKFTFIEPVGTKYSDNVVVTAVASSYGGVNKETIEQVRFRAPYFYTSQNRAVTVNDYETLMVKEYNYIDAISVWGGEDNDPVVYGKVYASIKTSGNYQLTNLEKERIKNDLIRTRNVLTVTPEIVDPDYTYILVRASVNYDAALTSRTTGELEELVRAAIQDYNDTELNKFNTVFRKSRLQHYIDNCEKSITGSDVRIFAQRRFLVDTNKTKSYEIDFYNAISRDTLGERLSTFPELSVQDANRIARRTYLDESSIISTGIESVTLTSGGSGYLSAPTVTIIGDGSGATATAKILSGKVVGITVTNAGQNYTSAVVTITGGDGSGASGIANLQASKGILRTIYYKSNGEKTVINPTAGTINFDTGKLTIDALRAFDVYENDLYDDGYFTISVPLRNDTISVVRNRILTIDDNDPKAVSVEMVAD